MNELAARNGGRLGLVALAAVLLIGLGLRLDYAWEGRPPVYDAEAYARIATNLADDRGFTVGEGATQPASNYSPGLPLLVAGLYLLTGEDQRLARVVLALVATLAVLFTYLIGRRLAGPLAGLIGAAAVAIYPSLLEYGGMLMGEPVATTLLSGAVLAFLWATDPIPSTATRAGGAGSGVLARSLRGRGPLPRDRTRAPRWLVPGLLFGLTALFRPEYLLVGGAFVLLAFLWAARDAGWKPGLGAGALLAVGLLLPIVPWAVRNAVALDRFVPISTGGGQVLFAGQYMPSGGDPERVGSEVLERHPGLRAVLPADPRLEQILAALAERRYPGMEADRALARMGRERLRENLTERPLEYAGFVAAKVWRVWCRGARDVMERPGWRAFHLVLVALAIVGACALAAGRRPELIPLALLVVAITAICALLVASPRRTLVLLPVVAALAGVGVTWARDSLARRWNG